ncbi:hypothetical protein C0993_008557 [Termitomyces sp. T159_Od127]|nr:hypothetical protein C0993_008557 [Termitomyces sp. T159_Od127]
MASGYLQIGSLKQRRIIRPGAVNLRLPLLEHNFQTKDESKENLLTLASSEWTISAAPVSSASVSVYSQASYVMSPLVFSETKLDRRRFGIAETPAQEGPWSRPSRLQSASLSVFLLDLKSGVDNKNPFVGEDEKVDNQGDVEYEPSSDIFVSPVQSPEIVPETNHTTSEATKARLKKLRMSTRVLGKIISRLSVHQSSSRLATIDKAPLLPPTPPQIFISPPSAGIEFPRSPGENLEEDRLADKGALRPVAPEKNAEVSRKLRARPSTWKPHRPPSPLPKSLRRHRKHKSEASVLVVTSPPPLPTHPKIASTVLIDHQPDSLSFSTPLKNVLTGSTSPIWADIQTRLKARAMKSSAYAIHDGGIISPTQCR